MAKRRMIAISVIESDAFCCLSASAQMLYLHLNTNADDDGIVDKWKSILRYLRVKQTHLDSLIDAGLVIILPSGLLVISDWLVHNRIRQDRYVASPYRDELELLQLQPNGRYIKAF